MQLRFLNFSLCMIAITLSLIYNPATAAMLATGSAACTRLASLDLSTLIDAPTQILGARPTEAASTRPASCEVTGYVAPSVGFVVTLPAEHWNEKLIQLGCNGYCGSLDPGSTIPFDCDTTVRRGYACIISDNGHRSGGDALWASNNLQAQIDHGYRGVHVTSLAGKAIAEHYYGRAPHRSYFMGSSTGGRLGLIAAQRFPWDFDGIVAGVPSISITGLLMNRIWANRALIEDTGRPRLSQADLDLLHRAVLAKCDLNDGITDGVIGDPRDCTFDPGELRCRNLESGRACLTSEQLDVVDKVYSGAVTARGEPIYMPGALKGSEETWQDSFSRMLSDNPKLAHDYAREWFRYGAFDSNPGPAWQPEEFDFDSDYKRFGIAEALSAAVNPDLRKFKARGGKLLAFAGWSDASGMPLHAVDYYETVERVIGGRTETQDFFRLFVLPGMGHLFGDGAFVVDWLS